MSRPWLPPLLLAAYALAFAWRALGDGLLVVDDHPGQLYRLAHAVAAGPWPWRIDPGWWAGYAELQYYPPGAAYAGTALYWLTAGALGVDLVYQVLLWVILALPGFTTYALLVRVLGRPWLALPGAFVALTLSAGSRSGMEEGLRWGLVASRLGWSLLPLLALSLSRWTQRTEPPRAAAPILAAIALAHPAHAPAGLALLALAAAHGPGERAQRMAGAARLAALAGGLAAFWLVPLAAHLDMALPLAWGDASPAALVGQIAGRPLLLALVASTALAAWMARRPGSTAARARWLVRLAPALAGVVALDALVVEPLGIRWLPADRLMDSLLLALVLGASVALGALADARPRAPQAALAAAAIAGAALLGAIGRPEPALYLWPDRAPGLWTKWPEVAAGDRLDALWSALREAPPGRILFVRSGVPLVFGRDWWRPHSHVTALTPRETGREIVGGTFTHPSPVAGLVYTGSAAARPITRLAEQQDGVSLFGRPIESLTPSEFDRLAERLRISTVVALDEDEGRLGFLTDNPGFGRGERIGPFVVFRSRQARPTPARVAPQRWRIAPSDGPEPWIATGLAYSPLWRAGAGAVRLPVRRDDHGLLEVGRPADGGAAIDLTHPPGLAEWAGAVVSALSVAALAASTLGAGIRQTSGS